MILFYYEWSLFFLRFSIMQKERKILENWKNMEASGKACAGKEEGRGRQALFYFCP